MVAEAPPDPEPPPVAAPGAALAVADAPPTPDGAVSHGKPPPPGFEAFWGAYPRKAGKLAAMAAYRKALSLASPAEMLAGIGRATWSHDPRFIPHPATWLNQGRWADVPDPAPGRDPRSSVAWMFDMAADLARGGDGRPDISPGSPFFDLAPDQWENVK